jgi:nitrogen fixation-related uncharacterized protein
MAELLVIATLVALLALLWVPGGDQHDDDDDDRPGGTRRRIRVRVAAAPRREGKGRK